MVGSIIIVSNAKVDNGPMFGRPLTKGCIVGGCSGQLCVESGNEDNAVSTCEYTELYGCYKEARCERQASGECGWTQTQTFLQCQNDILQRQNNANH
jgi:hypothetical protein